MDEAKQLPAQIDKVLKKEGLFGRKPCLGWRCWAKLKVNGELGDGITSDYLSADAAEIVIGDGDWLVDKGIESCLETMHVGEESAFSFKINENVELKVDISLEKCMEKGYIFEWSDEDKLEACKAYKANGVELFKRNRIEHAFFKFSKALKMLLLMDPEPQEDEYSERSEMLVSLYNNLANCQFHFKNYSYVTELCNKSVDVKPNVKGYFWRALACIEIKDYENAECNILELLKIEPGNKAAIEKYKLVRELNKQNRNNYETIVKNMFRGSDGCRKPSSSRSLPSAFETRKDDRGMPVKAKTGETCH